MKALLEVRNLSKRFGKGCDCCLKAAQNDLESNQCSMCGSIVACCNVSFDLHSDEVLGVVGESGSGKSTLVRLLHLEEEASAGEIFMNDCGHPDEKRNVIALSSFQKRQIRSRWMGIVYQNPHLGLRMGISAGGNVAEKLFEAEWRHVARIRDRAGELLAKTEIPVSRMDEAPRNFSGGMQQRVQIAKSLANSPKILLLDEVTTGLDLSVQAKVLDLIRQLQCELQLSVIVVSHDLGVIRLLCQRTMVMRYGRVVESGLTDQILEDPQHPYTQLLVSSQL
jgi:putative phosphonate transport system ATP-binding protein